MKKIIGYVRESTQWQVTNGYNLGEQKRKIEEFCKYKYETGSYELEIKEERGVSARNLKRPQIQSIIELIKAKSIDILVIHNLDRLTRSVKDLAYLIELLEEYSTELVSITESIDTTTPSGRTFILMIGVISQWEEDSISWRTKRGMAEALERGYYCKPRVPFGYVRDPQDKRYLIIDDEKAEYIRYIFETVARGIKTANEIYLDFKKGKVLGKKWGQDDVYRILKNKAYTGDVELFGKVYEGVIPAIVTKELQKEALERVKLRSRKKKYKYPFRGILLCSECGSTLKCDSTHKKIRGKVYKVYQYYFCECCKNRISQNCIQEQVENKLSRLLDKEHTKEIRKSFLKHLKQVEKDINAVIDLILSQGRSEILIKKYEALVNEREELFKKAEKQDEGNIPLIDMDNLKDLIYKYISHIKVDLIRKSIDVEYKKKFLNKTK